MNSRLIAFLLDYFREKFHAHTELGLNCFKVWCPSMGYFALISFADLKEIINILGGLVTIGCTIWVSHSTVKKNRRAPKKEK